jgi:hypothetical protein
MFDQIFGPRLSRIGEIFAKFCPQFLDLSKISRLIREHIRSYHRIGCMLVNSIHYGTKRVSFAGFLAIIGVLAN